MKPFSLRRRLTLLILASIVFVWGAMLAFSYREAREEVGELADARLGEVAQALMLLDLKRLSALAEAQGSTAIDDDHDGDKDRAKKIAFQVWDGDGTLLLHSVGAPETPFVRRLGFEAARWHGDVWRTLAIWNQRRAFQVRVFERMSVRDDLASSVALRMLEPLLYALPILAVVVWLSVGRGLTPLHGLSKAIAARGPQNLEPIRPGRVPNEIRPLIDSLNDLLRRLSQSIDKERRFTADAAHELRTPLSAIKVQAEVALAAEEQAEQRYALAQIIEGVNRTAHLVQQLLLLARLDHPDSGSARQVDLGELAAQCAGRYAEGALKKDIDLGVSTEPERVVAGDPAMLDVLIGNLIDNAIRYTQEHGRIEVSVTRQDEATLLSIKDNGPGVPEEARSRIMDRFYRVEGSPAPGSGLGLSIVERVATAHGATVELEQGLDGRGLGVKVRFADSTG